MHPPIIIAGPTRCGTTLLTGLIHYHGAWGGEAKVTQYPETNSLFGSENIAIKKYLQSFEGVPHDFKKQIEQRVHTEGPWIIKTAQCLFKRNAWIKAFPDALWLLPFRPVRDIIDSTLRHPKMTNDVIARKKIIEHHMEMQLEVEASVFFVKWVDMNRLARKNKDIAKETVEFCGLTFNETVWSEWVKPSMWHGKSI